MRIIFVYRGFGTDSRNSVIDAQIDSLTENNVNIIKFPVTKGGLFGYIYTILKLFIFIRKNKYDILHSHYSLSAIMASLSFPKKHIVSLMGSDVNDAGMLMLLVLKLFSKYFWSKTIVKSAEMFSKIPNSEIIPNGVDFNKFKPVSKELAVEKISLKKDLKYIIFIAENLLSANKNLNLARQAVNNLNRPDVELLELTNLRQEDLLYYYNAADVLLLTSKKEGSPNVIKEAMACCCPIVSTDAGDVKELLAGTEGTYVTSRNIEDIANKLSLALSFGKRTNGRDNIYFLNSGETAKKIINLYENILKDG